MTDKFLDLQLIFKKALLKVQLKIIDLENV
jgi:hypothetical protein